MTKYFKIATENIDKLEFELPNLGGKMKFNQIVNYGHGHIGAEPSERATTPEDYDKEFVKLVCKTSPVYKVRDLMEFHFDSYEANKQEFLGQIKYHIVPLMKKERCKDGHISLIIDWVSEKEGGNKPANTVNNYNNIKTGDINAPAQFQQNSQNSTQNFKVNYSVTTVQELFDVLKDDIESLDASIQEDFFSEMNYALKQVNQGRDIQGQLTNIGSLISNVGLPFFVNLVSSGVFEVMRPFLGL